MKEMRIVRWGLVSALVLSVACAWAARVEPNAFLNKRADTVTQLIAEVRTDNEVADRYERHFGKSKAELVDYFSGLHLARTNEDGTYMIYSVDDQGVIKARPQRVKAGTKVFADSSGTPVLKASCGNAMIPGTNAQNTMVSPLMQNGSETLHEVAVTTPESAAVSENAFAIATPATPGTLVASTPGQVTSGGSNQGFALPAALAALGGAGALLLGGGHSSPVPEPASIIVIVGALAAMKMRRSRK